MAQLTSSDLSYYKVSDVTYTTDNTDDRCDTCFDIKSNLVSVIFLVLINLAVIIGNILVLLAVYFERSLRTTTNYFIINLALADLLLGTLVLPFSGVLEVSKIWPFGPIFCDIWAATDVLCCTASINSLCCISIDRYIGVTRPLKHKLIMTPRRAFLVVVLVWIFSFSIAVGPLFGWRPKKEDPLHCPLSNQIDYVMFSVAGSFYIPTFVIIVLYAKIYREVASESKHLKMLCESSPQSKPNHERKSLVLRVHKGPENDSFRSDCSGPEYNQIRKQKLPRHLSQRRANFNREKKVAKTLGIVVGVFILCWFPFFFLLPLTSACRTCNVPEGFFTFAFWLGYCNSFMNPIIYGAANKTFRKAFKGLVTFQYCFNKNRSHSYSVRALMDNSMKLTERSSS